VEYIVLPTFAYEHKVFVGPFSRRFPKAKVRGAPAHVARLFVHCVLFFKHNTIFVTWGICWLRLCVSLRTSTRSLCDPSHDAAPRPMYAEPVCYTAVDFSFCWVVGKGPNRHSRVCCISV
jgi:hypothetical protein